MFDVLEVLTDFTVAGQFVAGFGAAFVPVRLLVWGTRRALDGLGI